MGRIVTYPEGSYYVPSYLEWLLMRLQPLRRPWTWIKRTLGIDRRMWRTDAVRSPVASRLVASDTIQLKFAGRDILRLFRGYSLRLPGCTPTKCEAYRSGLEVEKVCEPGEVADNDNVGTRQAFVIDFGGTLVAGTGIVKPPTISTDGTVVLETLRMEQLEIGYRGPSDKWPGNT